MTPANDRYDWIIILVLVLAFVVFVALTGCFGIRPVVVPAVPPFPPMGPPAPSNSPVAVNDGLGPMLIWLSTLSIIGIGVSIAAAIFLQATRFATAGIGGFGSILVTAITVNAARPYLIWVALGFAAVMAALAVIIFRKVLFETVRYGCEMEKAETESEAQSVRDRLSNNQVVLGVKPIIDATISKVKNALAKEETARHVR